MFDFFAFPRKGTMRADVARKIFRSLTTRILRDFDRRSRSTGASTGRLRPDEYDNTEKAITTWPRSQASNGLIITAGCPKRFSTDLNAVDRHDSAKQNETETAVTTVFVAYCLSCAVRRVFYYTAVWARSQMIRLDEKEKRAFFTRDNTLLSNVRDK